MDFIVTVSNTPFTYDSCLIRYFGTMDASLTDFLCSAVLEWGEAGNTQGAPSTNNVDKLIRRAI
jgi:hypothetical protein